MGGVTSTSPSLIKPPPHHTPTCTHVSTDTLGSTVSGLGKGVGDTVTGVTGGLGDTTKAAGGMVTDTTKKGGESVGIQKQDQGELKK